MANNDIFHATVIAQELQRICNVEFKSSLGLKAAIVGDITGLPNAGISNVIPGIWIQPSPAMSNDFDELPRVMMQKYFFRLVYVRAMQKNENLVLKTMEDAQLIGNTLTDYILLTDITNFPLGTHCLWSVVKSIEWRPPEDEFVVRVHADLTAVAMNLEVNVKTRRYA